MIQFRKHFVKNTENGNKAKVWYVSSKTKDGKSFVWVNAKEYGHDLEAVLDFATNDTDSMTDYFAKSCARIFEGDALYSDALAMCRR